MADSIVLKSIYGSHLYGTYTPTSDQDIKQIHMNSTDSIMMKTDKSVFNQNTNNSSRNTKDDIDFESKELRQFIMDCLNGQTYALDLLFTPEHLWIESSELWLEIISLRNRLVTRNVKPFIGYVNSQAAKYSNKGNKYNELKLIISQLEKVNQKYTFKDLMESEHRIDFGSFKYFEYYDKTQSNGMPLEKYLKGPDCEFPSARSLLEIVPVLREKHKSFGKRVEEAALNDGLDLKAYYHALRIVWQLEEYLISSKLTFPSSRVQDLIDIRNGKYSKGVIEEWISSEIERVLKIDNNLPEADYDFWDNWLLSKYMQQAYMQSRIYLGIC